MKNKKINSLSESMLKKVLEEPELDFSAEYPEREFFQEDIISFYNRCFEEVDPRGEQALKNAREMYEKYTS